MHRDTVVTSTQQQHRVMRLAHDFSLIVTQQTRQIMQRITYALPIDVLLVINRFQCGRLELLYVLDHGRW